MPRAIVATAFGGPDVLALVDVPSRAPGAGEVQLAVRAVGVNPIDWRLYSGSYGANASHLPMRIGYEAAGVITAVGEGAPFAIGDEVIAFRASGTYADELTLAATALTAKPAALDWAQAASLMLAGTTAVHALTATATTSGNTVLVHAGAGGVGVMAIQLARLRGARVIATASEQNHAFVRELGAEPVAYGPGLADRVRAFGATIDVALDLVGSDEALDVSTELVADRARIATIAGFARGFSLGIKVLGGAPGADPGTAIRDAARAELAQLAGSGALRVIIAKTYPLAEAAAAHQALKTAHTVGKLALTV